MPALRWITGIACLVSIAISSATSAHAVDCASTFPTVAGDAEVVSVREDCDGAANCFDGSSALAELSDPGNGWLWQCRQPADHPVLVDFGPGTFGSSVSFGFQCPSGGANVTLRGSGRGVTTIAGFIAGDAVNCTNLDFVDLGFEGVRYGFRWTGPGDSTWSDVDIVVVSDENAFGLGAAWADNGNGCTTYARPVHYFFGSRLRASGSAPYNFAWLSQPFHGCSETYFFGGEILVEDNTVSSFPGASVGLVLPHNEFQAFGTEIRVQRTVQESGDLIGVQVQSVEAGAPSSFRMHGGSINVSASATGSTPSDAVGLDVQDGTFANTSGTVYVVKGSPEVAGGPAAGQSIRVRTSGSGIAQAPLVWQSGSKPPMAETEDNVVVSQNGSDLFVETDCSDDGDCDSGGNATHLMVYNPAKCGADVWLDVVTGRCRGDTGP